MWILAWTMIAVKWAVKIISWPISVWGNTKKGIAGEVIWMAVLLLGILLSR